MCLALLAALVCGPALPGFAQSAQFELGLSVWQMGVDGTASVGSDGVEGTIVDLQDDLGYDQREDVTGLDLVLGQHHQLELSYLAFDISAQQRMVRQVRYGGETYEASTRVSSSLDANLLRVAYRFEAGADAVRGGVLIGLQLADLSSELSASGVGTAEESVQAGLPVIGAFATVAPVPFVAASASVACGSWNWSDTSVSFIDAQAMLRLNLFPFFLAGGYRFVSLEGDDTGVPLDMDVDFEGPQFAAGLQF